MALEMRYIMKCMIFSVVLFLVVPSISAASYVIKLKNGRKISVQYYWEKGDKILFNIYGGTVEIRKDLVKEIEDLPDEKEEAAKQEAPETTEKEEEKIKGQGEPEKGSELERGKEAPGRDSKKEAFLEEKRRIMEEMERVSMAFREAKASNDKERKDEHWERLLLLQTQLSKLHKQVMAAHEGKTPPWWDSVR